MSDQRNRLDTVNRHFNWYGNKSATSFPGVGPTKGQLLQEFIDGCEIHP